MFFIDNIDIKILKFINKYEVVPRHKIFKKFPEYKFDTSFRLENLEKFDSIQINDISIFVSHIFVDYIKTQKFFW
ncbi:hypothetical protein JMUB3936_p2037 (plasmid) [Leptotrichia wadei]|uniref:Uncharacterized protein n=1 Tax=Leptotrichia wadei TaxID=157687 RepID=A0A510KZ09_9FUSO|nr:hypothetical protein JMUB3936_p2037 [Leptotrichia wadei]